ncbi:hypothetical protein V7S43_014934 [Phytophthora oleae]|uniref:Uncharacterized protein n=1 Tax=Phytophthora oleae TaxID=2107226 RepID=A0ABD3F3E1_9STRA
MVRKIQRVWRCWTKAECERRQQQQLASNEQIQSVRVRANVRKIQGAWRRRSKRIQDRRSVLRLVFSHTLRIQRWWRKWQKKQRVKATRNRIMQNACAQVIQRMWRRWHRWQRAKRERRRLRIQRDACARRLQKLWRQWRDWKRRREASAVRIQRRWEKWQKKRLREKRAVERIQRLWSRWRKKSLEKIEREHEEERQVALKIQQNWTGKLFRRNKGQAERKRALEEQWNNAVLIQRAWKKWHLTLLENERQSLLEQEEERRNKAALMIQHQWRKFEQLEAAGHLLQQHACVSKIQELWQTHRASIRRLGNEERVQENTGEISQREEEQSQQKEREEQRVRETQNESSVKIQRNWGICQHRRKMERQRVQHEQHMAALKIQTLWLKWHHEQREELERERIRQEQDESSFKIERSWGMSQQRRRVSQERLRHRQNFSALMIQKHWRRWWHLRLEQRTNSKVKAPGNPITTIPEEKERAEKLEVITRRSYGRCVARTVKKYLQSQREHSAATKIEAIWKGKLYRMQYLQGLEMKHTEEAREYRLLISVLATKVQVCWRQQHVGIRKAKRAVVKSEELLLIQEAKALEKKLLAAKRQLAAKRIQRALASRRSLIATKGVSHREVVQTEPLDIITLGKVDEEKHVDPPQNEESVRNSQEEIRATVEMTVEDWGHRQLPHILSRSVNQILFCHEAASVLQNCIRSYLRRRQMCFYFQRSFATTTSESMGMEHFNLYFKRARAWLDYDKSKSTHTNQDVRLLRLRLDAQMTRKLLQVFEPSEEYTELESHQVLQEIAADVFPILQSPACVEDNENSMPELRYHDVEEMELPLSVKLLREMEKHRAYLQRQVLLEVDTRAEKPSVPLSASLPSSPIGKSAPSSPSHRAKKEMTIFTAVETASVEDAAFLQQRGFDLGALEVKTQRNALHMLSFSKETYRSRAEMLEFLLSCGANLNVNSVDCNGDTPLMLYASLGHLEFMKKLLQHGADPQLTNSRGQNVLHRACEGDQVEICGFLQQLMMKDSIAEIVLPVETISSFVPAALSLHTLDRGGRYPLHYLAEKGFIECAKQLVVSTETNFEWNRSLQAQGDSEGRTALHLAVLTHDVAMTAYLLTPGGGSDVNAFDDLHRSPLHYAVESPAAHPIISRLVQYGANLNVADERGDTPLHWTAFSGRAAVMQNLLALGADPTLRNSDWENPAQIAAAYGQLDCMRLLVQAQRRFGASQTDQQQPVLNRPASEKTALQRLEEAVDHLHQKQASAHSIRGDKDIDLNPKEHEAAAAEQSHGGYWEELHQDVQLVEESGQFSSEDEEDLLFGSDGDPSF